jgi:hypothetical protein
LAALILPRLYAIFIGSNGKRLSDRVLHTDGESQKVKAMDKVTLPGSKEGTTANFERHGVAWFQRISYLKAVTPFQQACINAHLAGAEAPARPKAVKAPAAPTVLTEEILSVHHA